MSRWEPDAPGRLQRAALELFTERDFERTTVEDIAARAGVTKRTFFRHFADKREVLFGGAGGPAAFQQRFVDGLAAAPADAAPLEAVVLAIEAACTFFEGRHSSSRRRGLVIAANPELQERELVKLAAITAALADGLRARGVDDDAAGIAAQTGMGLFLHAFEAWVGAEEEGDLAALVRSSLRVLQGVAAAAG